MRYFKLPDLGEGLTEAEIVEWYIKPGDTIKEDHIMLAVETAKAIVEIPSPQSGVVENIFGAEGDTVHIGEPLVEYQGENDSVSVVGNLSGSALSKETESSDDSFIIGHAGSDAQRHDDERSRATPSVRALARRLSVDIVHVKGTGPDGRITMEDVEKSARMNEELGNSEPLKGVRKAMAKVMAKARDAVVPVTLFGDADVTDWKSGSDITIRMAKAIAYACGKEPAMNSWFDGEQLTRRLLNNVDLGIAVDTEQGLFVPVLRQVNERDETDLLEGLTRLKNDVASRVIPPSELTGATITLSNYGSITAPYNKSASNAAGRYGTPVVVPPMVTIVGTGSVYSAPAVVDDEIMVRRFLPLSVTFDHRAVTGGEATRFMAELIRYLQQEQ